MAERYTVESEARKDLEKEITCLICHEHYTEPKVFPCCHYYCKKCVDKLVEKASAVKQPLSCPECRVGVHLPEGGVDKLPNAFFVNRMKEVHSKLELAAASVSDRCESCGEEKSIAFCRQCDKHLCAECVMSHQKQKKLFPDHEIVDHVPEKSNQSPLQTCETHKQALDHYCCGCSAFICSLCAENIHNGHDYQPLEMVAAEMKKVLSQQMEPLKELELSFSTAVKEIQTVKKEVRIQETSVANYIRASFRKLYMIIKNREQALLAETTTMVKEKLKHLSEQEGKLSSALVGMQSVLRYTEQCLQYTAQDEIMGVRAEIQGQLKKVFEEYQKEEENLEPVEEANLEVEVSCADAVRDICQTKAKVSLSTLDCTVNEVGLDCAILNEASQVQVTLKSAHRRKHVVEGQLKSLRRNSVSECRVDQVKVDQFSVQYTPVVRGRHELALTLNGQQVPGSPFPLQVPIHPTQISTKESSIPLRSSDLGKSYNKTHDAIYVGINSAGEIIVVTSTNKIATYSQGRKFIRSSNISAYGYNVERPGGLAIDSAENDQVYVVGSDLNQKEHVLLKLKSDLTLIKHVRLVNQESEIYGLGVLDEQLMICKANKSISVHTKDLDYVKELLSLSNTPRDIFSDRQGTLYVSTSSYIAVLKNDGFLLRVFGQGILSEAWGVHGAGGYIYVANKRGVSVFTTEGKYVTSFMDKRTFSPRGLCLDKDGFVYICDSDSIFIY